MYVDAWNTEYSGSDGSLKENFNGPSIMSQVNSHKYLGHHISNNTNNYAHIEAIKIKSIRIKKKILDTLQNLKLGQYYFECAVILFHSLLRGSLLFSVETFHNTNEKEIRDIEKIEEDFLITLMNTQRSCPRSQIYLELGICPARFQLMKIKILFYHYILNQSEHSLIFQVFEAQKMNPIKGDWVKDIQISLKYSEINQDEIVIKNMKKNKLKSLLD